MTKHIDAAWLRTLLSVQSRLFGAASCLFPECAVYMNGGRDRRSGRRNAFLDWPRPNEKTMSDEGHPHQPAGPDWSLND